MFLVRQVPALEYMAQVLEPSPAELSALESLGFHAKGYVLQSGASGHIDGGDTTQNSVEFHSVQEQVIVQEFPEVPK